MRYFIFLGSMVSSMLILVMALVCLTGEDLNLPFMGKVLAICGGYQLFIVTITLINSRPLKETPRPHNRRV